MRMLILAALLVCLGGCGKPPAPLSGGKPVGHWVERLQTSPDPKARKEAAFKLGNVGPTDPAVLPALRGALGDRHPVVRGEAVLALVKLGPAAREAVPALAELGGRDRDPKVRGYASRAARRLQGGE